MNHKLNLSIIGFILTTIAGLILFMYQPYSYMIAGGIGQYMVINLVIWITSLVFLIKFLKQRKRQQIQSKRKQDEEIQELKDKVKKLEEKKED